MHRRMTMRLKISDVIAQPHLEHFNSRKLHQIDKGGRAGYKSSKNAIKIAIQMLSDPTCEVVVARQDYSDHKDSTFAQLKWAFNKLGVPLRSGENYPQGNDLWIRLPQGNYVHFKQMKEIDKLKGTMPTNPKNHIKIVWYFEITQFKSEWFINEGNATFMRGHKDYLYFLYEYNDHPKRTHWTYNWVKQMERNPQAYVKHTNYNDAPLKQQEAFLGEIMIQEIERIKDIDYEQYKSTYLGLPANLTGTIYKRFDIDKHVYDVSREPNEYIKLTVGVDYGETDATTFTLSGIMRGYNGLRVIKHYYHKNGKTPQYKGIEEYTNDLIDFLDEIHLEYNKFITVEVDSAAKHFWSFVNKEKVRRMLGYFKIVPTNKQPKGQKEYSSIEERIKTANLMFGADFIGIDTSCKELIKAIDESERDEKGNRRDDGLVNMDSIDSWEYSWMQDINQITNAILRQRGYAQKPERNIGHNL